MYFRSNYNNKLNSRYVCLSSTELRDYQELDLPLPM